MKDLGPALEVAHTMSTCAPLARIKPYGHM